MKLWPWRKRTDEDSAVIVDPEEQRARELDAQRAVEESQHAVARVHQIVPKVEAHKRSMSQLRLDNGLAAIILNGFRKGQA